MITKRLIYHHIVDQINMSCQNQIQDILFPCGYLKLTGLQIDLYNYRDDGLLKLKALINKSRTNRHTKKHGGQIKQGK